MFGTLPNPLPMVGVVVEVVSGMAGIMAVSTGLVAGAMRAVAILKGFPPERVEWMTAAGFVGGFAAGALVLAFDLVFG
jgi:stage V sporulation protein SpoVS